MALNELQNRFIAYLHNEAGVESAALHADIVDSGRIGVERRLHIYHHAYRARLVEVLQDVFERTWAYLGDDGFADCARTFIESHPPAARTLNRFGADFPAWLAACFPNDGEIAEVAAIDWQLRCAFDGDDAVPLSHADIVALSVEDWAVAGFEFHPTANVAPISHNAASIWDALEQGQTPPAAAALDEAAFLLTWRKGLQPHFVSIGRAEADAIALLQDGEAFATTCALLDERYPNTEVAQILGKALRRWVDEEMLIAIRVHRT
jgi:Putative DNA-binding domain